jgi:hypothetical protein
MNPVLRSLSPDFPVASFASDGSALPLSTGGSKRLPRRRGVLKLHSRHSFFAPRLRFLEVLRTEVGGYSRD